jgi:hypothetical protein
VRLVPGTELAVAPKQRKSKHMAASQEASSEAQLSKTVKPAWLRVQELDSQLLRHLQFRSLKVSSKPTTVVYISAATAKLTGLTDGLLVTVVSKEGDTHSQSGEALGTAARGEHGESHGAASGLHEALLGDGGKKGGGNEFERRAHVVPASKVVVRVRLDDGVARGHVMVAAPLLSQLGVTPFSREFCRFEVSGNQGLFSKVKGVARSWRIWKVVAFRHCLYRKTVMQLIYSWSTTLLMWSRKPLRHTLRSISTSISSFQLMPGLLICMSHTGSTAFGPWLELLAAVCRCEAVTLSPPGKAPCC